MKLYTIHTGNFKLDGGAMFGVVPKTIWNKLNPADENNMCNWAMRCLLIEDGNRLILVDNGIGDKQDARFFSHYYLNGDQSLDKSLQQHGFHRDDITDVLLTHLHFDHCGGSIRWNAQKAAPEPAFKNAVYWVHEPHWHHALNPNVREKASFLKDNIIPIEESGQMKFVNANGHFSDHISLHFVHGHTTGMLLPKIKWNDKTLVFMADLIPSTAHLPPNYVMSYDIRPLDSMNERSGFLQEALENKYILFFEHDPVIECCTLQPTEKGVRMDQALVLAEI